MNFFEKDGNALIFRENGETVKVMPWGSNSLRVQATFLGELTDESIALLPVEDDGRAVITIAESGQEADITNGELRAHAYVQPWGNALQLSFYDGSGRLLLQEIPNGGALQKKARHFKPLAGGGYHLKASFIPPEGEKIYGMGQYQQEVMDLKGCNMELAHRNSQASIPFYISSQGYGFLWHNGAIGEVHFGTNTTEWVAENTSKLDYWITAGDTPAQIMEAYTSVTGRAPQMPEYGLGYWQCKLRYYNEEDVLQVAEEYHKRDIPVDVLVIDYYHWPRCGDWRFDEEFFPHPDEMIAKLQEYGIETMVSVWPQVDVRSENYDELRQQGLLIKSNSGVDVQMLFHGNNVFFDATNPRARDYIWDKCKANYYDKGVRLFWLDEAEPEFTTYDHADYRCHMGAMSQVGNAYPREYSRAFYEGMKAAGQEAVVNLVRCAWVGSQRYGALVWSGDIMSTYEDFRKQICAGIHMGLSGIPWWTTDIGGFHGGQVDSPEFRELLIRWFEFGTFCPVMRMHGCRQPGVDIIDKSGEKREWTGAPNEVYSYGPENEAIMVRYIRLRERMRDYTRSLYEQASRDGSPIIRAMFYEFPQDAKCWELTDQYMYGPDILVAPVCHAGATSREVYLPAGDWFLQADTGIRYEGGQTITVQAPLETIPLFLRQGRQAEIYVMKM